MRNHILFYIFCMVLHGSALSQKKTAKEPVKGELQREILQQLLQTEINKIRTEAGLDTLMFNEILFKAADFQAADMSESGKASLENSSGKYRTTGQRIEAAGGTQNGEEIVFSTALLKGKAQVSESNICQAALVKWKAGKKELPVIKNPNSVFFAASTWADEDGKKVYISVVFGGFNSFKAAADKRKELPIAFTKKNKKVKQPDVRACKNCAKFKDYDGLIEGVYEENGRIYIKYDNLKALLKLIRKPKDGLAIDIVQRAQYAQEAYNIYDNNLRSRGILLKTTGRSKLLSKNRVKPEKKNKKVTKLDVEIGRLPKKLQGAYEMNLLVVLDGKLCKTIRKTNLEINDQDSNTPLEMLLMPDSNAYFNPMFAPVSESSILLFNVPFEKGKFDYKAEDMEPFLNTLQEPDFFIEGLYITAYSSIEGDAETNARLQKQRAESIISALSRLHKSGLATKVKTNDSWQLFQMELEDGKYDYLTKMSKQQAIKTINADAALQQELEPYLARQRFAQIIMDVSYDTRGPKEEKFSIMQFNKAAKKGDIKQCLKIQYFIEKQVREKRYNADAPDKLDIPLQSKFSGVLNNKVVFRYQRNGKEADTDDWENITSYLKLDTSNNYLRFNELFCEVKLDSSFMDAKTRDARQARIDALYATEIPKKYVDALNIEWQFKIIESVDTLDGTESIVEACINRIKSFYNFKDASWENALKLSYVFARFKDYTFAANLLASYVKEENPDENLLFAFVSYCAKEIELCNTRMFVTGMHKARLANPQRYCALFGYPHLTFQVLENPLVKEEYIRANCGK